MVVGWCGQPIHAANVARVISLRAGIPKHVPALTLHRNCASGMEAISVGAQRGIGGADIIAVGFESIPITRCYLAKRWWIFFNGCL